MVYVKSGYRKRFYNRRFYRRNNTLSKRNIFKNKTAKSQAGQIYALKKKVNNLSYHIKPETITKQCMIFDRVMTTTGEMGDYGVDAWSDYTYIYKNNLFNVNKCNYAIKGNHIRPYNFTIYGEFGNKNYTYPVNEQQPNAISAHIPLTGYVRIILCKVKGQQTNLPAKLTKPIISGVAGWNDFGLISGPLVDKVTSTLKIVKERVIKVNESNPSKNFKIVVKNPGLVSIPATSGTMVNYNNDYALYVQYYAPDVLKDGGNQVGPIHYLSLGVKFAFTDTD